MQSEFKNVHVFKTLVENSVNGICIFDSELRLVYANKTFQKAYETVTVGATTIPDVLQENYTTNVKEFILDKSTLEANSLFSFETRKYKARLNKLWENSELLITLEFFDIIENTEDVNSNKSILVKKLGILEKQFVLRSVSKELVYKEFLKLLSEQLSGRFGFIIEVYNSNYTAYALKITQKAHSLEKYNIKGTFFSSVLREEPVILNKEDLKNNNYYPKEFPDLESVLLIPVFKNGELLGYAGIGYDKEHVYGKYIKQLTPVISSLRLMLEYNALDLKRQQVEFELKRSETKLRQICENISMPVVISDPDSARIIFYNHAFKNTLGFTSEALNKMKVSDFDVKHEHKNIVNNHTKILKGDVIDDKTEWVTAGGNIRHVLLKTTLVEVEGKKCVLSACYDVTEQRQLIEDLSEKHRIDNSVIASMDEGILVCDKHGNIIETNVLAEGILNNFGDKLKNIHQANFDKYPIFSEKNELMDPLELSIFKIYENGNQKIEEIIRVRINNENRWFKNCSWCIPKEYTGEPIYVTKLEDVTDQKKSQEELIESRRNSELFFNQSLYGFYFMMLKEPLVWNEKTDKSKAIEYAFRNQYVTKVNDALVKQYNGYHKSDLLGKTPEELFVFDLENAKKLWYEFFNKGNLHKVSKEKKLDGKSMWVEGDYVCLYDSEHRIIGHFGVRREVTKEKEVEIKLKQERERFKELFENVPVGILTTNERGMITSANPICAYMFGYDLQEMYGMSISHLIANNYSKEMHGGFMRSYFENPQTRKMFASSRGVFGRKKNGDKIPVEVALNHFVLDGNTQAIAIITDISEKEAAEQTKKMLEERETLLKEIHHRVKNNMQVISSLLSLQSAKIEDKQALNKFKESEARIKSMALIHEKLYESESLSEINANEYLPDLVNHLVGSYSLGWKIRIDKQIENIRLNIEQCIPFGLIVNELITNSLKYAFNNRTDGEIRVYLSQKGNLIKLIVWDNGSGIQEDFKEVKTLGMRLIHSLSKQLQGSFNLENSNGVKCTLEFPVT